MLVDRVTSNTLVNARSIPIYGVNPETLQSAIEKQGPVGTAYIRAVAFKPDEGRALLVPRDDGALSCVLFGTPKPDAPYRDPFLAGNLVSLLPEGLYRLADGFDRPDLAALGFELASYRFSRFRKPDPGLPSLEIPDGVDASRILKVAAAIGWGRDLINRPANDLGPDALEDAIRGLADRHQAPVSVLRGEALIEANFPMVHAVGRAAVQSPRLVEFVWGPVDGPKITLVGKGVCFDTGGLDIKPSASMALMKKDMGGAATALALAAMIMDIGLPVRLKVIVPIVENAVDANSFRPGDVLRSRKGLTVEIGNTDAEGRLILADALAYADEEAPEILLDFATLTGAARVALGPDLPPFYTGSDVFASDIARNCDSVNDPCWRLPLWDPYDKLLKSKVADLNNIASGSFAGSITAALFLRRFVEKAKYWAHFDVYGWTPTAKPGRPEGGEVQTAHGVFKLIAERYGPAVAGSDA